MARRRLASSLCVSILSLYFSSGCVAKGKRILEILQGFAGIVAYGSLISMPSQDIVREKMEQILFVSKRDGNAELYLMNADGSEVKRLTNSLGVDYAPLWRPAR